jgi:hypothetical protein
MGLALTTPPAAEPLTMTEAIRHIRLDEKMLEPVPDAPTVALAGAGAGNIDNGAHRYRLTFVTADGETDGGAISAAVMVVDKTLNGKVGVSNIPLGGSQVTARKLYRTAAAGATYFLAATIADNTTTTVTDNTADASLGAGIPLVNTTGDPLIHSLIVAAREYAERFQSRAFITQQWTLSLDGFPPYNAANVSPIGMPLLELQSGLATAFTLDPHADVIRLPKPPLLSVDAIHYVDVTGVSQLLDPSQYVVDPSELRGEIRRAYGVSWPSTRRQAQAVTVLFTCGYGGPSAVPERTKQAMKLLVGHWYANREAFVEARFALEVPFAVDSLLWLDRALEAA